MSGIPVGYGTIKTLTDASVRNCVGDLRCLRPTIMIGVPAVWELIKKGIDGKVKHSGALSQFVFHRAIAAKKMFGTKGIVAALTDKLVFSAVKEATGGRLKIAVNGGAPIGRATQEFLSLALVEIITG
jgi:long-chain acyl-CoA synthetase